MFTFLEPSFVGLFDVVGPIGICQNPTLLEYSEDNDRLSGCISNDARFSTVGDGRCGVVQ